MSASPRVSIIIPCYNTSRYVAESLASVFAQTFRDYEVIVVNDGSPDTPELERAIEPWLGKVVYIKTANCGLAGARNNGIRASKGELIAFLDSDDIWESNYLEVQVCALDENPSADIVYPKVKAFGDVPATGGPNPHSEGEVTLVSVIQRTCEPVYSALCRRESLERVGLFDDRLRSCEDLDIWLRCLKAGSRIIYHDQVLLRYRVRRDSLSADPVWMNDHQIKVMVKMSSSVPLTPEERRVVESAIVRFKGEKLFSESKRAFLAEDYSSAIESMQGAAGLLKTSRIRVILFLLRAMPRLTRTVYIWRSGAQRSGRLQK